MMSFHKLDWPVKDFFANLVEFQLEDFNVPFLPVLTKSDKLSNNKIATTIKNVKTRIHEVDALAISSQNGTGFDKFSAEILKFIP